MAQLFPKRIGSRTDSRSFDRVEGARKGAVLRRFAGYLAPHGIRIAAGILLTLAANAAALAVPRLSGAAIDQITGPNAVHYHKVFAFCGWMLLACLLHAGLSWLLNVLAAGLARDVTRRLREEAFAKLHTLPVRWFDQRQAGDIVSHLSYDIDAVGESLSHDALQVAVSAATVAGSLVMMFTISPPLVLVFAVTVPLNVLFSRRRAKLLHPLFKARAASLGQLNGFAEEMLSGQRTIAAYGQETPVLERFDGFSEDAVQRSYDAEYRASTMGPCVRFINDLGLALVCMAGASLYMLGEVTAGPLTLPAVTLGGISSFVLYSRRFSGPFNELANLAGELQSALAAAERVFTLLDEEPEPPDRAGAREMPPAQGRVELRGVTFGYDPAQPVLKQVDIQAQPGARIALVGPTGAGKTTVINLLMRFYDPDAGAVLTDGREIRSVTRDSLRRQYTMVLQDTWLFSGTVYENIAYGRDGATRDEVIRAAKAAMVHPFIERLPQGYGTQLSDDGVNLSKGQKQLLTIARAMLADANLLILDEATSNVDSRTERLIQQAMYRLMRGKTCFVIAHRLSTVRGADEILVVDGGGIAERGTHEQLMAARGIYYALYTAQFS